MENEKLENLNGIDVEGLQGFRKEIGKHKNKAMTDYNLNLQWMGGTKTKVTTKGVTIGEEEEPKEFSFTVDEPEPLLGENSSPTPQEYLLGGMGACMMVGYTVGAAVKGI